jgi:uncharacterized Tic20 family protein
MSRVNAVPQTGVRRAERDWAALSHALFGVGLLTLPFMGRSAPLVLAVPFVIAAWIAWWDRAARPFAARHARASLDLQLSLLSAFLVTMLAFVALPWLIVRIPAVIAIRVCYFAALALSSIGCFQAAKGRESSFHLIRFIS